MLTAAACSTIGIGRLKIVAHFQTTLFLGKPIICFVIKEELFVLNG
ncbi:hypothetical protein NEIMUCOT_05878 [Neisseria mucosa ATCC 25996]|uniref:Uncharacterized protein n=1 Tax=Neisseria mucosa (strain ATCC 25996 / DSM 4631 / NCTC 10774 / M26) TaxID=546266 RepID=D2ZZ09_NEIM2|nr:hypothetical protein NEIMUCOT_05878 [Neisseria mucosa ATCC 25996]